MVEVLQPWYRLSHRTVRTHRAILIISSHVWQYTFDLNTVSFQPYRFRTRYALDSLSYCRHSLSSKFWHSRANDAALAVGWL